MSKGENTIRRTELERAVNKRDLELLSIEEHITSQSPVMQIVPPHVTEALIEHDKDKEKNQKLINLYFGINSPYTDV